MRIGPYKYLLLFAACILSRALTAIYYIEDIDSLRFALAAQEFDVVALQPHFPGYPAYCFVLRILYELTHLTGLSFALLGGAAIFGVVYFAEQLWREYSQRSATLLQLLLFFSPLMWLMSNRYMPDIMGLALLMGGTYWMVKGIRNEDSRNRSFLWWGLFLGLEAGVRLSYVPFFFPAIWLAWKFPRQIPRLGLSVAVGVLVWLLPFILVTGWEELLRVASIHTEGHFMDWGGGVTSEDQGYAVRARAMFKSIWADGLGAWWPGRHWTTIGVNLGIIGGLAGVVRARWKQQVPSLDTAAWLVLTCLISYAAWAFFFQNIIYKPRHVMPLLPFLIITAAWGWSHWGGGLKLRQRQLGAAALLAPLIFVTAVLVWQHTQPSAISQMKTWLKPQSTPMTGFLSNRLINHYLARHQGFQAIFFDYRDDYSDLKLGFDQGYPIYSTRQIDDFLGAKPDTVHVFFHNPFVNRLWSDVYLYQYQHDAKEQR